MHEPVKKPAAPENADDQWHWGRAYAALAVVTLGFALLCIPQVRVPEKVILVVCWYAFWGAVVSHWMREFWSQEFKQEQACDQQQC